MKLGTDMQYLTWFLPFLTCKVLVAVNLKLLATNTHRRLSISDSLAELLVLIDLEKEMVKRKKRKKENLARVSGGGELAFPESNRKEDQPADRDPNRSYLLDAGLGDLLALVAAALQELDLGDEVLALDGELLGLRVRLAQHLHEAVVRAAPRGQVDLARSGRRHQRAAVVSGHGIR